jgi:hypothetical protein
VIAEEHELVASDEENAAHAKPRLKHVEPAGTRDPRLDGDQSAAFGQPIQLLILGNAGQEPVDSECLRREVQKMKGVRHRPAPWMS